MGKVHPTSSAPLPRTAGYYHPPNKNGPQLARTIFSYSRTGFFQATQKLKAKSMASIPISRQLKIVQARSNAGFFPHLASM